MKYEEYLLLPGIILEQMVCVMEPDDLCNFVASSGGIQRLRTRFSIDGFQKFMLYFVMVLEEYTIEPSIQVTMKKQLDTFANEIMGSVNLYDEINCDTNEPHKHVNGHWDLKSLGFANTFDSFEEQSFEKKFYECKFWRKTLPFVQYSVPVLPASIMELLPKMDSNVLPPLNLRVTHLDKFEENMACIQIQFFRRLTGMTEAFGQFRPHETLAFGFELLTRRDFYNHPYLHRFYLHVYAMTAVTLSFLNVELEWSIAFMEMAKKFMNNYSELLDILLYNQMVSGYARVYKPEENAFTSIVHNVPENSQFFIMSFQTHLKNFIYKTESDLGLILCYKRATDQTEQKRDYMFRVMRDVESKIKKMKTLVDGFFHHSRYHQTISYFTMIMCDMYQVCLEKVKNGPSHNVDLRKITYYFHQDSDFRKIFFNHHTDPNYYDIFYYNDALNKLKKDHQEYERIHDSERYGDMMFSFFILFELVANEPRRALECLEDCKTIYKQCNSLRFQVCQQFENKTVYFTKRVWCSDEKKCNVVELLKEEPRVAKLTRLGLMSIEEAEKAKYKDSYI